MTRPAAHQSGGARVATSAPVQDPLESLALPALLCWHVHLARKYKP